MENIRSNFKLEAKGKMTKQTKTLLYGIVIGIITILLIVFRANILTAIKSAFTKEPPTPQPKVTEADTLGVNRFEYNLESFVDKATEKIIEIKDLEDLKNQQNIVFTQQSQWSQFTPPPAITNGGALQGGNGGSGGSGGGESK